METLKIFFLILIISTVPHDSYAATVSQYAANPIPSYQYTNNYGSYQVVCPPNQFRCTSGLCIHESLRCNGIVECPSGDDEKLCPTSSSTTASSVTTKSFGSPAECAPNKSYQCQQSKRCIPWSQLCDGEIHCLYGDDENQSNCKLVPGFDQQQGTVKQNETVSNVKPSNNETNVTESESLAYEPTTYDYSNQGNYSNGAGATEVKVNKVVQSSDHADNRYYQGKDDAGFVFVNFGPIINGDSNVNGNGNDLGNGNGNGNENGNGNGNGNGNENGNTNNNHYPRFKPLGEDYKNYYNEGRAHYT